MNYTKVNLMIHQYECLHWVLVRKTVEIEGNEYWRSKTFTLTVFIYPLN